MSPSLLFQDIFTATLTFHFINESICYLSVPILKVRVSPFISFKVLHVHMSFTVFLPNLERVSFTCFIALACTSRLCHVEVAERAWCFAPDCRGEHVVFPPLSMMLAVDFYRRPSTNKEAPFFHCLLSVLIMEACWTCQMNLCIFGDNHLVSVPHSINIVHYLIFTCQICLVHLG